jgi:predicted heme/steroid binding protein
MSATLRIVRVNQLPNPVSRNTLYLVDTPNPIVFDIYLSSADGQLVEHSYSAADVLALIETLKNVPNGIVGLDGSGLIPSNVLPSFVDDVIEYPNVENFPVTGQSGKIYIATVTNRVYRWSGSAYFEVSSLSGTADSALKLETPRTINGVPFDGTGNIVVNAIDLTPRIGEWEKGVANGVATLDSNGAVSYSQLPELVYSVNGGSGAVFITKVDLGLGNVDNTSDINKPVSTATQAAIDLSASDTLGSAEANTLDAFTSMQLYVDARDSATKTSAIAACAPSSHVGSGGTTHAAVSTAVNGFMLATDKVKLNAITGTNTGDETATTIKTKLGVTVLSGSNTGDQTDIPGNSATTTKLKVPVLINGVSFDGSTNVTVNAVDSTARIASSEKGAVNGVATLDGTGKIPSIQLPSFVDDVVEAANFAALPVGEVGKIYVTLNDNKTYRWSGSAFVYITSGAVDSVAGKTGVVTLVKSDVGLANVDNTSDVDKPVSTAQQAAINTSATATLDAAGAYTRDGLNVMTTFVNLKSDMAQTNAINASTPIAHVGSGGTAHSVATTTVAGFMSSADKTKLNAITGTNTGDQTTITGNAGSATVLQTARTINGVSFNGSSDITINAVDSTARIASTEKGVANGVATLDSGGKVPSAQLPSFVDDVIEATNLAAFPVTGETGKIYVALDTNKTYRWSGSAYIFITSGAVDSVAGKTGVVTLVKGDVGLGNVDNTADTAKPVSTAQQTAITNAQNAAIAASAPSSHVGSGGTSHANASNSVAGFMSAADKAKLDAILGTNTGDQTTVSGNAGSATVLQTARLINGVSFNGSSDITINAVDAILRVPESDVGIANGVAPLDANGKLPFANIAFTKDIAFIPALTGTTLIPFDNTTPLVTEGTQLTSITLGPSSATSQLYINGAFSVDCNTAVRTMIVACFRDSVCIGAQAINFLTIAKPQMFPFAFYDVNYGSTLNGTTGVYSIRFGVATAATWYVNRMATVMLNGMMSTNNPVYFEELN